MKTKQDRNEVIKPVASQRVLYVQFNNPASLPPLEHSSRILAENGWQVLALGAGQGSVDTLTFPVHPNIQVRLLPYCAPGWRQKLHFLKYCFWIWRCAFQWRPRWIYVSDLMACPAALPLTWFSRWKVIYHEHDSPAGAEMLKAENGKQKVKGKGFNGFMRFVLWTRRQVARRAAFCVVPNSGRAQILKAVTDTPQQILSVWNCPRREEARNTNTKNQKAASRDKQSVEGERETGHLEKAETLKAENGNREKQPALVLYYHGSIVPARLPLSVLQAMALLPGKVRLRIAGYETNGHPGYVGQLQTEARRLDIGDCIDFLGSISRSGGLMAACRQADVGLTLLPEDTADLNEQTMPGASNKPFDYLACGLPLLVSARPEWVETFVKPGYALGCHPADADSIAATLRQFIADSKLRRQMGELGRERILADWNYETQFAPVLKEMLS